MPLYLFLIFSTLIAVTIQANSQCSFSSTPTSLSPFPTTNYLSYSESTKFVLDNYFTGINLSFSYNLSDVGEPQQVQKTLEYTNGYLLDALPQLAQSQLIDIYWDDSNVTSVAQQWTSDSLLLFLTEANSIYTLIVGSFDNIQASNTTETPMYSSIIIQPPAGSSPGSQLQCSTIIPVGGLQYYIDCVLTDNSTGTVDNYFYYISFPAYPPSDYNVTAVLNTMTLQYSPIISSRVLASATNSNCTYLVRYYNGLLLPSSTQINTTIEVFNVTDPLTPTLTVNYNISMPGFAPTANISSLRVSANFMYIATAQGNIIIVNDWYTTSLQGLGSNIIQQYAYDEMTFQTTDLRVTSFGGQTKESFIAIGVLNSVNLTALLFVSQTFQEFYTIPLPPFKQTTLDFEVYSVALGEDFAGISYSVSETFSDSACYYYAIADISFEQSSDCHTLWTFEKDSFISYSKMNPAADTDILFVLGMDNQYSNYSIFRPAFALYDMVETTQATLNIQSSGYSNTIDFSLVVMSPNDQCIYLDLDSSDALEAIAFQTNSDYLVFLNQSIFGPELDFAIQSDAIASYNVYTVQQIASNYTIQEGSTFLSMHRKHVSSMKPLLLLENAGNKTNLRLGTITGSSIFNITSLNLGQGMFEYRDILEYYYISGYDIFLYNQSGPNVGPTMLYLDVESYLQGNTSPGFNVDLDMFPGADIIQIVLTQGTNGEIQAILITNTIMYVGAFVGNNPATIAGAISTVGFPFPTYPAFTPATIQAHIAFPDIAFITTTAGNITYIIEYSGMLVDPSDDATDEEGSLQFNIIFAQHPADSAQDVVVQPFTNNLFYIFPALNVIEHWDLSVVRSPFFRRNLDLYTYNLSVLTNSFVQKGSAFSSTTDTLYILAQGNNTDNLYVLVLKPTPANSYIVQAIELPFSLNSPQTIAIDVTETQNFVYGNLLGDILVVLIGSNYYFWEIHSTPYLTFPVRTTDFDEGKVNVEYSANFTVQNQWNITQVPMNISIYQNEKQISTTYPEINITSTEVCSITFGINDLWSGTVYNFSIANPSENVSITPFMYFTQVSNFSMSEQVDAVLEMTQNTYYLTSDEIILVDNKDPTITHQVQIIGPEGCSMYIDTTETYGVAICGSVGAKGIYPFYLTNFFNLPCDFINTPTLQDIFIDANNSLMFLLMQAANGGNSNITVYNTDQSFCNLSVPIFVMQGWSFSGSSPNFGQFDVLVMSSTQVIHMIFVLDLNFGLRIINYASMVNLVAGVYSYSFEQLYQYLGPAPDPITFCDIQLLENECELDSFGTCNANLLLVAHNFHAVLLQFQFENSGLEMPQPQFTVFLVPGDYWIDDYEFSGDLLILLGRNITQPDPGLDMLAYNMSYTDWLQNGLDPEDPTIYQVPMWVTPLVADAENCPEYPLVHPTISLQNDGETYMLSFPNLQNQSTVNYNITSNITVSWNNDSVIQNAPINIVVANNFQEVVLPVIFVREETRGTLEPVPSKKWFYIGCGMVGLGVLILALLAILCYRRKYKNRIQYSRKLQKDPLRELMMY